MTPSAPVISSAFLVSGQTLVAAQVQTAVYHPRAGALMVGPTVRSLRVVSCIWARSIGTRAHGAIRVRPTLS